MAASAVHRQRLGGSFPRRGRHGGHDSSYNRFRSRWLLRRLALGVGYVSFAFIHASFPPSVDGCLPRLARPAAGRANPFVIADFHPSAVANPQTAHGSGRGHAVNRNPMRHAQFLNRIKDGRLDLLFLGDSITDNWPRIGESSWMKLAPYNPADFGISGERTEDVLWRITNGELDGIAPKVTVLMIGTNNIGQHKDEKPEWTVAGIRKVVATIHEKLPKRGCCCWRCSAWSEKRSVAR